MADQLGWLDAKPRFEGNCFDAIRDTLRQLDGEAWSSPWPSPWPTLKALNQIAHHQQLKNFRGIPLKFTAPKMDDAATQHYETRIAEMGHIATRENWHDFFNAMQWLTFPKAKSVISEMHTRLIAANDGEVKTRSIPRDVLTLFDEGGIIVASHDTTLLDLIRNFQWRTLFVERREDVKNDMHFYLAGHSVLEKMLNPFIGITAKALLITLPNGLPSTLPNTLPNTLPDKCPSRLNNAPNPAPVLEFDDVFDNIAATWLLNESNLSSTRNLHPIPILGIPGWDSRNESPRFYDNTHYFRSGRIRES